MIIVEVLVEEKDANNKKVYHDEQGEVVLLDPFKQVIEKDFVEGREKRIPHVSMIRQFPTFADGPRTYRINYNAPGRGHDSRIAVIKVKRATA